MARRRSADIDLLRLVDLLQEHITPALCHAAFGRVRQTDRPRLVERQVLFLTGERSSLASFYFVEDRLLILPTFQR